jgi:U3 small nucleolar RNA-associated protein 21
MPDSILMLRGHRESSMLCVALENFTAIIVDYDTKSIIRKFQGHTAAITDACFSPDSLWLLTSSMDCTIKTWDIPSSYMIDHFRMPQPCVSLAMSPAGNYLATAHVDFLGIYLWANKTLYENVPLRSIDPLSEAPMLELPSLAFYETLEDDFMKIKLEDEDGEGELIKIDYKTPDQLDSQLITLSTLAESKWRNLLNLDVIKKRNKPKEAPKKPRQAPFFLPTVAGLEVKFDLNGVEIQEESRVRTNLVENLTAFGSVLKKSRGEGNYKTSIQHIINLNPSMIDFEVKSLDPMNGGSIELMLDFLKMLVEMFDSNLNFELAQSYLALFLKHHEKLVIDNQVLNEFLDTVEAAQNKTWSLVENQLLYGIGVVSNLRNFC